jgi:hypothetical protein
MRRIRIGAEESVKILKDGTRVFVAATGEEWRPVTREDVAREAEAPWSQKREVLHIRVFQGELRISTIWILSNSKASVTYYRRGDPHGWNCTISHMTDPAKLWKGQDDIFFIAPGA